MSTILRTPEKSNSVPDLANMGGTSPTITKQTMTRNKRKRQEEQQLCHLDMEEVKKDIEKEITFVMQEFMQKQSDQMTTILTSLKDIQQTSAYVQNTITFLCEEHSELKQKIENLEIQARKDREQIVLLETKLEENMRTGRKSNIEIKNVPLKGKETKQDILEMVFKLSENLKLKMDKTDIKDIIKLSKTKKQQNNTIIVEFSNTFIKNDILKAAKQFNNKNKTEKLCAKHLGINTNPEIPIFFTENLTPHSSRLYFLARDLKNIEKYKYCWTSYGKVYLRYDDDSPIIHVVSESQIRHLANK
ncbi:unnamed protein product [Chilo suppressalis]|uniref:FP protein C-terminal domain-containing protein n=1 Tax=Chilo suppressalis TaxID=168631 RepID=A0ABN8AW57_CHISP|nr:unnamed protein product [Chilo suppressalis]